MATTFDTHTIDRSDAATARGARTIERALDVVGEILDEGGEVSLRLAAVSRRSGISIGSLYHHFGSREGLILAARERQFSQSLPVETGGEIAYLLEASDPHDFVQRLAVTFRTSQAPNRAAGRRRRLELLGAAATRPEHAAAIRDSQTRYLDSFDVVAHKVQALGWLRDGVEPRALSWFLHAMSMGRVLGELDEKCVDAAAWTRMVIAALNGLLCVDEAPVPRA